MAENVSISTSTPSLDPEAVDLKSEPFVGRWEKLVSRTNWEKGRIIQQWRETLIASGAPPVEYSDEAWSQRVFGVTGQHVGRLRRVALRFGGVYPKYKGLFWSHFQAAIDWEDAEMWLEGAVQNKWSISQMRAQRHEALGGNPDEVPDDDDIIHTQIDEDHEAPGEEPVAPRLSSSYEEAQGPLAEGPDFGSKNDILPSRPDTTDPATDPGTTQAAAQMTPISETVRPFDQLPELPENVAEAFETFKLAILSHKADQWKEISPENLLATLEALKTLVLTPSGNELPT